MDFEPLEELDLERVADLFARARALGTGEEDGFFDRECGEDYDLRAEVESLLRAAAAAGRFLEEGLDGERAAALLRDDEDARRPDRVGPYRLIRELGRGGMGTVYLAERDDDAFRKQVAVKRVDARFMAAETLGRFRTERQILANLEHPNIARVLDGGTSADGVPYVVMEHVDGVAIDTFCAQRGLGIEARLELFLAVCSAVSYAHRNLVVHRDLKPSNVLVADDATPKLLDFGIAKLLAPEDEDDSAVATRASQRPMTPAYASPEQVRGEAITTAVDVYGLGALLYQLLAGRPPLRLEAKSAAEIERAVCEEEPPSPASGRRDLDNVVLKALRKEPAQRYAAVADLAEDVRRHLAGRPVSARPATLGYRLGKFLRRHRAGAAATLAVVAILAATIGLTGRRLARERDVARAEAAKARQVTDLLVSLFKGSSPRNAGGAEVTAAEILDAGTRRLEVELADQPEIHAELLLVIARVDFELDHLEQAAALAQQSLETRQALYGDSSAEAADSREVLAQVRIGQADFAAARELLERVLADRNAIFGRRSVESARAQYSLGMLEIREAHEARAREILEEVLALREALLGPDHVEVGKVLNLLAVVARRLDEPERAEELYRRALAVQERALGPEHPDLAFVLNNLGVLLSRTGRLEEARAIYERALAIHERAYGGEHDLVAGTLDNLGETLRKLGRLEEAIPLVERALAYREKHLGPDHHATGTTLNNLANIYRDLGRYDEAVPLYERAIAATAASMGADSYWVAWPTSNLGQLYLERGDTARARALFERALALRLAALGEEHSLVAASREDLARLARREAGEE